MSTQEHVAQAVEPDVSKAFPANGKILVKYGGRSAEALLELPAPSTRDGAAELPSVVWLTVGLLATDTFALQVCSCCSLYCQVNLQADTLQPSYRSCIMTLQCNWACRMLLSSHCLSKWSKANLEQ